MEGQDKNKSRWANETKESLELMLKTLMRKYPHQTTPLMQEVLDELEKKSGEKAAA